MTDKSAREILREWSFVERCGHYPHTEVEKPCPHCDGTAHTILAALEAGGFAVVPVKPTPKMIEAAQYATFAEYERHPLWEEAKDVIENIDESAIWSAMLAASNPKEEGR